MAVLKPAGAETSPLHTHPLPSGRSGTASLSVPGHQAWPRPSPAPPAVLLLGPQVTVVESHPSHKRPSQEQEITSVVFGSEILGTPFTAVS